MGRYGLEELARRAEISVTPGVTGRLFVVARYSAFIPGFSGQDDRAVWADWNHLVKTRMENPQASVGQLARILDEQLGRMKSSLSEESYVLPIDHLAVILNPTAEPSVGL